MNDFGEKEEESLIIKYLSGVSILAILLSKLILLDYDLCILYNHLIYLTYSLFMLHSYDIRRPTEKTDFDTTTRY